jgi:hypothetical protein
MTCSAAMFVNLNICSEVARHDGGYPWLEIVCSRCKAKRDVDLAALPHVSTPFVHDLSSRLVCQKCRKAGKRPVATLLQLTPRSRHEETKP